MSAYSMVRRGVSRVLALAALLVAMTVPTHAQITLPGGPLFTHDSYDYAPSMITEGSVQKFWWCGGGGSGDAIYYRSVDVSGPYWSDIVQVLTASPGSWDSVHVCDPSVIRGVFVNPADSNTYSYAMYYTAADQSEHNNHIGVAFSNDGINWVKYPYPVIAPQGDASQLYGAGQAATYNGDGQAGLWLFHTDDSTQYGGRMWVRSTSDGINFSSPTLLSNSGVNLYANSDFGYDSSTGYFYAAIEGPGRPDDREAYGVILARMPASDLLSGQGTWEELVQIDTSVTGAHLNHSPGLLRDGYGNVTPWLPVVEVYFAWGNETQPQEASWDLTWAIWQP